MAKLGEGDARWIVQDRPDGTNVNNWHWTELNALDWAKKRLQELLGHQTYEVDGGRVCLRTGNVDTTGEAVVNLRKQKLIPTYELQVKGTWTGVVRGSGVSADSKPVEGNFSLPYVSEENADEAPELQVATSSTEPGAGTCKEAFSRAAKPALLKAVAAFVKELAAGGPGVKRLAAPGDAPGGAPGTSGKSPAGGAPASNGSGAALAAANAASKAEVAAAKAQAAKAGPGGGASSSTGSFRLQEKFVARPADLYAAFTDPGRVQAFTQGPAKVEPKPGGAFEIFDGSVEARFEELDPTRRLVLSWRFKSWPPKAMSKVVLTFEEVQTGTTEVTVVQTGVPREDGFGNSEVLEATQGGWRAQIFARIRGVFGYGMGAF